MGWDVTIRALLSLVLVLGLIAGVGFMARRFGVAGGLALKRSSRRRLGMVEQLQVDSRRRLLLIKKDDTEFLVLIGGSSDLLLSSTPAPEPFTLPEGPSP